MRLTRPLCKIQYRWMWKNLWKSRGYVRSRPAIKPWYLKDKEVVNPAAVVAKPPKDPLPDTPQFHGPIMRKGHPDYHQDSDDFVYEYSNHCRLMESLDQACILTKTQPFSGLPKSVQDNMGVLKIPEQDLLVQRYIMQANVWDPTKEKLPRRINKAIPGWRFKAEYGIPDLRIRSILLRNLIRLCQMIGGPYPDLVQSRVVLPDPYILVSYMFQDTKTVLIRGVQNNLVTSSRPLAPFASEAEVDETSIHEFRDLSPLSPTIDLVKQQLYRDGENIAGFSMDSPHPHPHTLFISAHSRLPTRDLNVRMLMNSFAQCLAIAKARHGADVKTLDEPICVQSVLSDGKNFHFGCFQLNTVDFSSSRGVKNLMWFDNDNAMYRKILPQRAMLRNTLYEEYDPDVFKKLLALYINGADVESRWPQSEARREAL